MNTTRFFEYAKERHAIYLRRLAGEPKPWTKDPILQQYRFTNVYRELDKTTVWFRKNVRDRYMYDENALLATVIFRWFNRIETGEAIFCQPDLFNGETAFERLLNGGSLASVKKAIKMYCGDGPYVTGAYMIKSPTGISKLDGIIANIKNFMKGDYKQIAWNLKHSNHTLEYVWTWLKDFDHQGPFLAYEVVTDLRHTSLLYEAPDIMTWANPGPGCMRGLSRMQNLGFYQNKRGITRPTKMAKQDALPLMVEILNETRSVWPQEWPRWEMREVEHTLCEWDKYERVRLGHGTPKGRYS